ncbi:hypothetical protein DPMN_129855 [Dreissena polymorpha]|uniref:Uncharacterized protein n=1 Tax=Dreissena polymorpha TaxID=45954 RepID=A0A9D4H6M3_DREPO|nr:hypothetical protein DPMN_129855 [Dreissena polymorpha]
MHYAQFSQNATHINLLKKKIPAEKVKSVLYKVEYKAIGNEGPKYKIGMRAPSNIYTGPANSLVQPVDTKGNLESNALELLAAVTSPDRFNGYQCRGK